MNPNIDLAFPHSYQLAVLAELPATGHDATYYYPKTRYGGGKEGIAVRIAPSDAREWLGIFAFFDATGLHAVHSCPDTQCFLVVSGSRGILVRADQPDRWDEVPVLPINEVRALMSRHQLLVVGETTIGAIGDRGFQWESRRLAYDQVHVEAVEGSYASGRGWNAASQNWVGFVVNLEDGTHEGGCAPP